MQAELLFARAVMGSGPELFQPESCPLSGWLHDLGPTRIVNTWPLLTGNPHQGCLRPLSELPVIPDLFGNFPPGSVNLLVTNGASPVRGFQATATETNRTALGEESQLPATFPVSETYGNVIR